MKRLLLILVAFITILTFLQSDTNRIRASEVNLPQEYVLHDESISFSGDQEITIEFNFEVGDLIIFELYPQADVLGYWFVIVYDGDNEYHYEYAETFREIDQNNTWSEFDVVIIGNEIVFTNSYFDIDHSSSFWDDEDGNRTDLFPYAIPTYLIEVVVYK